MVGHQCYPWCDHLDGPVGSVEADLSQRPQASSKPFEGGFGRELFSNMREQAASAEAGGGINLLWRYQ